MIRHTPWGMSQTVTPVTEGIEFHTTPSHGGYFVSAERQAEMPDWMPKKVWYEEDCDWAFVALAFPSVFPPEAIPAAKRLINLFCPDLADKVR